MIKFSNVSKSFDAGKTYAVQNISFDVNDGETLVLLGSSGCGKTTTLKMINRLVDATCGIIEVDKINIHNLDLVKLRRSIGYVFQGIGLFPHMSVEENIAIVLRLNHASIAEQKRRAHELLETVGLNPKTFAKRFAHELSGGQQQRVGVARSLASDPKVLLMDEPFGALDAINRTILQNELIQLKKQLHKTIVFVTHDLFEALRLGDRIAVMNHGRLEQIGTKEQILGHPATEFVHELFTKTRDQLREFIADLDIKQSIS